MSMPDPTPSGASRSVLVRDASPRRQETQYTVNTRRHSLRRSVTQIPPRQEPSQSTPPASSRTLRRAATQIPSRPDRPLPAPSSLKQTLKRDLLAHKDELSALQNDLLEADKAMTSAHEALMLFMAHSITLLHMYPDSHPARIIEPINKSRKEMEDNLRAKQAKARRARAKVMALVGLMLEKKGDLRGMCQGIEFAQFMDEMRPREGEYVLSQGVKGVEEGNWSWL